MNIILWIIQALLAILFLFAGGMKLVTPMDDMAKQMAMSVFFLKFIGVAEVLGGLGLILPGLLKTMRWLTPLAAGGLVIIMLGAMDASFKAGGMKMALLPFVTALLLIFVAYGRSRQTR